MRVLSIIGVIVFSVLGFLFVAGYEEIEPFINDLNSIGEFASIFDAGENISDFTESIDAVFGLSYIADSSYPLSVASLRGRRLSMWNV